MDNLMVCTKCKKEKSLDDFYKYNRNSNGVQQPCKSCTLKGKKTKKDSRKDGYYDVNEWGWFYSSKVNDK